LAVLYDKEVLDLVDDLVQVIERPHVTMVAGIGGDGAGGRYALGEA